jgi:predicted GNAT superfamily acetyltransferase
VSEIRDIVSVADLRAVEALQREVWGAEDRDIVPLNQLVAAREAGGVLVGAFDGATLVGFAYGFPGVLDGAVSCHSHLLAVRPGARRRSLGYDLKRAQRARLLARGITRMTWTFDPLRTINAHLNFAKLGVIADRYIVNFYGDDSQTTVDRAGTDRLWVTWRLDDPIVRRRLGEGDAAIGAATDTAIDTAADAAADAGSAVCVLRVGEDGEPEAASAARSSAAHSSDARASVVVIEVPEAVNEMESEELRWRWRQATREAFGSTLAAGHIVCDFIRPAAGRPNGVYVLRRPEQPRATGALA